MKGKIKWLLHMIKRIKSYDVVHCYDENNNYEYSILCLHNKIFGFMDDFVRIKYNKDECEIEGDIGKTIRRDVLMKETARRCIP